MQVYSSSEFAQLICVSVRTLRRWDHKGLFPACRTPSGRPYYTSNHYTQYVRIGLGTPKKRKKHENMQYLESPITSTAY